VTHDPLPAITTDERNWFRYFRTSWEMQSNTAVPKFLT
jgi:hypothetical protein